MHCHSSTIAMYHGGISPTSTRTTIQVVVDAFGHTQEHPSTLGYIAAAVKVFGGNNGNQQSFQDFWCRMM
jgi:hypothetical protein